MPSMRFAWLLLLALFGTSCDSGRTESRAHHPQDATSSESAEAASESPASAPASDVEFYDSRGTLLWSEPGRVYLNHEEIPGFMDAMAMGYLVKDPSIVEGIEPGTTVLFRIVVESDGQYYVDQMTPASAE